MRREDIGQVAGSRRSGSVEFAGGGGLYVQLSATGLLLGGGAWHLESDQVQRMRSAMADDHLGPALEELLGALRKSGWTISGNPVKTRPHGYDKDHPRLKLLRFRALSAHRDFGDQTWLATRDALQPIRRGGGARCFGSEAGHCLP